jgi:hypothetical protein
MTDIWVIASQSGIVRRAYGWFETEEKCLDKCKELRKLRVCPDDFYTPVCLGKNTGLGKN